MKRNIVFFLSLAVLAINAHAQDSTSAASTFEEDASLIVMSGVLIPLAIAGTVVSVLPPGIGILHDGTNAFGTFHVQAGIGFGGRKKAGVFADYRLQVKYTSVMHSSVRNPLQVFITKDFHWKFLDRREIFMIGGSPEFGMFTDFPDKGYFAGGSLWIMHPNLPFFGLFPLHTIGVTYHYNRFFSGNSFSTISLGAASALTFEW